MTTTQTRPPGGTSGEGRIARSLVGARLQEFALAGVIVLLVVIGAILKPATFPTTDNLRAILTQASVVGVLAIGMTFVIATAGIDLSVGSIVAAAESRRAAHQRQLFGVRHPERWRSGCSSAQRTARPSPTGRSCLIATLAMLAIARGLALQMSGKRPISLLDLDGVRWFGTGEILGVPSSVVIFLGDDRRLDPAEPDALWTARGGGRREPRGRAHRRRARSQDRLQRLLPFGADGRVGGGAAVRAARQRVAGFRRSARTRRDRRNRHRRHEPRGRPSHDRRHVHGCRRLRR